MRISDWSSDVCSSDLREQRFRDVAETAAGWIWETDAELRFTYLSDRVEQAAGVDKSVFLGRIRTGTAIFEDTPEWQRHVDELKHRRPFQGFEYTYRHPDGSTRYFRINGRPYFAADRSEERRVGKRCGRTCRSGWLAYN